MRAPNQQFFDTSIHCEANNQPIVAWPEDCGQYTPIDFPLVDVCEIELVEKWDLIHVEEIDWNKKITTRPGRAYARYERPSGGYLFGTFEPRDSGKQKECSEVEDTDDAYAEGYADAAADVTSIVQFVDDAVELSYMEGYGSGEERGYQRGWHTGYDARGLALAPLSAIGPYVNQPDEMPESSQPEPSKFIGGSDSFIPDEELNTVEFNTTNSFPKEETEMSESNEVCSPCERLDYLVKAFEVVEQKQSIDAVLRPLAEMIGPEAIDVIDQMENLFDRTIRIYTELAEDVSADERDSLLNGLSQIIDESLALEAVLDGKVEKYGPLEENYLGY